MPAAGKLNLRIHWDGTAVLGIEVQSTRPPAYRLLSGRQPEEAVQLIPLLYSVCGKAQQAAALAALSAAQGRAGPQIEKLERAVVCEAMLEHLWRLLLDWPKRLGLPPHQKPFVRWHAALNAIAAGQGNEENLKVELHQVLLGMTAAEWRQLDTHARLLECLKVKQGLLAPIIMALDLAESRLDFAGKQAGCDLMPVWTVFDVNQQLAGQFGSEFAVRPQDKGRPLETGALALTQRKPFVQDVLRMRPARLLARLIARLLDLLDSVPARGRIEQLAVGEDAGLSVVQTARGMLLHQVRIETGRIAQYLIVAPTEWNFHPQGALKALVGLQESNMARLMETVKLFVLSLDPCVEFEIEVVHA
jgi:hypothetical protein